MRKITWKLKSLIVLSIALIAILLGCLLKLPISSSGAERQVQTVLMSECSLDFTNSWQTVNASGEIVNLPFYIRRWKEYFLLGQGRLSALESWSNELGRKHATVDFHFIPDEYVGGPGGVPPPKADVKLASWWRPDTNSGPMMEAVMNYDHWIINIYGFKKTTNALIYIHILER